MSCCAHHARLASCLIALIACSSLYLGAKPCFAEDEGDIQVFVRAIEATNPSEVLDGENTLSEITAATQTTKGLSSFVERPAVSSNVPPTAEHPAIDSSLADLRPKLAQLSFTSFRLLCSKQERISLMHKAVIHLPRGQSLAFRPVYMDNKRVGLWLNWKDANDGDILNTRIHFDTDDSVLTGTDSSHNSGLILAIKAVPLVH